jgi:aspartyl-tRNA(Asn)/glutamyl-tRNA(Gln) amidotransferase subunit A
LDAPDRRDPTTLDQPLEDFTLATRGDSIAGLRIAMPDQGQFPELVHGDVVAAWQAAGETFESLGARVESVHLPDWYLELTRPTGTIMASEAFSVYRDHIEDMSRAIGPTVRGRALAAKSFAPGRYAEEIRRMGERRRLFAEWFSDCDAILIPTVGVPAIPLSEVGEDSSIPNYLTRPANYLNLCSLTMPSGFSAGLPLGVQIISKPYAEGAIRRPGKTFQDATDIPREALDLAALGLRQAAEKAWRRGMKSRFAGRVSRE